MMLRLYFDNPLPTPVKGPLIFYKLNIHIISNFKRLLLEL